MPDEEGLGRTYVCTTHGPKHDYFLSYRVATEFGTVSDLKKHLGTIGPRHGKSIAVFHDVDCLVDANAWRDGFLGALPKSSVIVLLVSLGSAKMMKDKAAKGQEDNVILEIKTTMDLMESGKTFKVVPLLVATQDESTGTFSPFVPDATLFPGDPVFDSVKQVIERMMRLPHYSYYPKQAHKRIYQILSTLLPNRIGRELQAKLDSRHFCEPTHRVNPDHLDYLLRQVTMNGRAIISGPEGSGKSVLARQFMLYMSGQLQSLNRDELDHQITETIGRHPQYARIYWIDCSSTASVLDDLSEIFPGVDQSVIRRHAAAFFAQNRGYLLIVDHVDDPKVANFAFEYCRATGFGGDVVVATRFQTIASGHFLVALKTRMLKFRQEPLHLGSWTEDTALQYLLAHPAMASHVSSQTAKETLQTIVSKIDPSPLAIQTFIGIVAGARSLASLSQQFGEAPSSKLTFKSLVELSMDLLSKESAYKMNAIRMLGSAALLSPEGISLELIRFIALQLKISDDVDALVQVLAASRLLQLAAAGRCRMHPLTQHAVREYIQSHHEAEMDDIKTSVGIALVAYAKEQSGRYILDTARHLNPYIQHAVPSVFTEEHQIHALTILGEASSAKCQFQRAEEILSSTLEGAIAFYGTRSHAQIADILGSLASALREQGRHDEAHTLYEDLLGIQLAVFGTRDHLDVARFLHERAKLQSHMGKYKDALRYHQEGLEIQARVFGTRMRLEIAAVLADLGGLATANGHYDEAYSFYQEAIEINAAYFGTRQHPKVAAIVLNTGDLAQSQGRSDKALKLYQESLELVTQARGATTHPGAAVVLIRMSAIAESRSQLEQASAYLGHAIDILAQVHETREHADVAKLLSVQGDLARALGDYKLALELYHESLNTLTKVLGTQAHVDVAAVLTKLGPVAHVTDNYDDAFQYSRELVGVLGNLGDAQSQTQIAVALVNLGHIDSAQGRPRDAIKHYREALSYLVEVHPTRKHVDVATTLMALGLAEAAEGMSSDALAHAQESLDTVMGLQTAGHQATLTSLATSAIDRIKTSQPDASPSPSVATTGDAQLLNLLKTLTRARLETEPTTFRLWDLGSSVMPKEW
ncbi:uncharacterized protein BJ171DRAFT_515033 [Polychytrium aggregatum]|uniref:uncharacterized protein n=1 Tax=Polychytrium aggregatum TaxID=110093 RepID=UPI0022FEC096|nr:uncharacterized protein BJ171DRAFT_515033 [Polychytrium aggregatum]KAI9202151.1 hypothetical protein BJ171DRAFT_515033 [Polychytrium aggregatum]